jgi:hypothetical protein
MEILAYLFLCTAFLSMFAMVLGLVKPLLVGWFWAKCNRRKVLKKYGLIALISWVAYFAAGFLISE